jgi:hypothetical protein
MKKISKSSINYGDNVLVVKTSKNNSYTATGTISGYNKGFVVRLSSGKTIVEDSSIKIFKLSKNEVKRKN